MFGFVTRDVFERALDQLYGRVLAAIHRSEKRIMSSQQDFTTALNTLATRLSTLQADMQAQVDAAVKAQKDKDDAANAEDKAAAERSFSDATSQLTAMIASLPQHAEEAAQTVAGGDQPASTGTGAPAAAPAAGDAPAATDAGTASQP